jgi:alpha-glucosidase (family GH31 glycosyl hydrolase)
MRYQLLTYLYSSMHLAHTHGGTLARPLFFADPTDAAARRVSTQWMLGEALLVSPVMQSNATTVPAYFTDGSWWVGA